MTRAPAGTSIQNSVSGSVEDPLLPDYGGACIASIWGALDARNGPDAPTWLPRPCVGSRQVVLLVLDGIGWGQFLGASKAAPTLCGGAGGPITSVVPTTTATALTSITTGCVPAEHGVVGYRLRVAPGSDGSGTAGSPATPTSDGQEGDVLNVLRWRVGGRDVRRALPAGRFQPIAPFGGADVPAVTRAEFAATGFTALHLAGTRLFGWAVPSTMVSHLKRLLGSGEPFVYAYYDGLDKVAHSHGLAEEYERELKAVDRLVGDILEVLPPDCVLVVTSDHGQVEVGPAAHLPDPAVFEHVAMVSGEGRFRWLHARRGAVADLLEAATEAHGSQSWVVSKEQVVSEGWFGGPLSEQAASRLGDVALVAREPVAYLDPADTGETRLAARHGSVTEAEMRVPLVAWRRS